MNRRLTVVNLLLLLSIGTSAAAQVVTGSTGAINGTVGDNTKAVLPGVTVSLQSPQMMGTRDAVTDDQGRYQFAAIPPGEYKVTFTLPGFTTFVRENIRVTLGFTATVNAEMQVASQQETITVTGQSPVVDTQATKITNNFDAETMANLPSARDFPALMAETPGVSMTRIDVGGSAAMSETGFTVYGIDMSGNQNMLAVEGISNPSLTNLYTDFGSFQEVQIETAAHTAEMPMPGVFSNMISKSGGNTYTGTFYMDYERKEWGSRNIDERQLKLGVTGAPGLDARDTNRVDKYKDINGGVGGYVIKDKLWWAGSFRYNASDVRFVNFPAKPQYTRIVSKNIKVTYNLTPNHKFVGFYSHNMKVQPEFFRTKTLIFPTLDEPLDEDFPISQYKGEYNAVLSKAAFLEVRVGEYYKKFSTFSRAPNKPYYFDTATVTLQGGDRATYAWDFRPQMNGSISYFRNGWGNSHNFKFGWEIAKYIGEYGEYGGVGRNLDVANARPDIEYRLVNGVPAQIIFHQTPTKGVNWQYTYSAYVNDAWQLNNYLSLNVGLRFDRYQNAIPDQVHPVGVFNQTEDTFPANDDVFHFNTFGPRLGLVWNVRGDGKTVAKANWARYPWRPSGNVVGQNPNPQNWSTTHTWTDSNGDRLWQPGEEGLLVGQSGGFVNQQIDPNWKDSITTDLAGWLEREIFPNFGVRTGLVWRSTEDLTVVLNPNRPFEAYNVPVTVTDPGPDGALGTADDGGPIQAFNLDPAYLTTPLVSMTTHNVYVTGDDHYTWEISGSKRMTNHWSVNMSFAHTWSAQSVNLTNPNRNHFAATESDGRRHFTNWQGKIAGTLQLPRDVKISPVIRNQSGDPYGRTIQVRLNYGVETIQVEPEKTRRVDNVTVVDVRLEKGVVFRGKRIGAFLDVFNVLNDNPAQNIVQNSASNFQRPIVIVSPRVARIGAKFEW